MVIFKLLRRKHLDLLSKGKQRLQDLNKKKDQIIFAGRGPRLQKMLPFGEMNNRKI